MKTRLILIFFFFAGVACAQAPLEYGSNITLANARKIATAAEAYAAGKSWTVVIAIVDTGGNLVFLEKIDNTQIGSLEVAITKAKTANGFKRPSKVFQDGVANGGENLRILSLPGAIAVEGGEPIVIDNKVVGAIGVSGMSSAQDTEVVKAGLAAIR